MNDALFSTRTSGWSLTTSRLAVAGLMLAHGLWKLGAWGGPGFDGSMRFFTEALHLPAAVGVLVVLGETAGALLLAAGAFTRIAAAGVVVTMLGAIATVHWPNGFFMNWTGTSAGEGFELHLLVLAMAGQLLVYGGGRAALDPHLARYFAAPPRPLAGAA